MRRGQAARPLVGTIGGVRPPHYPRAMTMAAEDMIVLVLACGGEGGGEGGGCKVLLSNRKMA